MQTGFLFKRKDGISYDSVSEGAFMPYKPEIELPILDIDRTQMLGADSSVTKSYGSYRDRKIVVPIFFKNYDNLTNFYSCFDGMQGELKFNYKRGHYKVSEVNSIFVRDAKGIPEIDINLTMRPFLYLDRVNVKINKSDTKVYNQGNRDSKGVITIHGSGNCTFYLNENSYVITNLQNKITFSSETLQILSNDGNTGEDVIGDLKKLLIKPNENIVTWLGSITKVEISFEPILFE